MEEEIGGKGMVSGVCLGFKDPRDPTVIMVQDTTGEKSPPFAWGLPGGIIEEGETPRGALIREWEEETGYYTSSLPYDVDLKTKRTGPNGEYEHSIFLMLDNGKELRNEGSDEVGPPKRQLLEEIASGKIEVFYSHLWAIYLVVRKMAMQNRVMAHIATKLAKRLNIDIEAE